LAVFVSPQLERPGLWSALANNPSVGVQCRRYCVEHLFRRHVRPGMKVSELARLLDKPTWLVDTEVLAWSDGTKRGECFDGWCPLRDWPAKGGTAFCILPFTGAGPDGEEVWLRVSPKMARDSFIEALRAPDLETDEDPFILEVVCFPGIHF